MSLCQKRFHPHNRYATQEYRKPVGKISSLAYSASASSVSMIAGACLRNNYTYVLSARLSLDFGEPHSAGMIENIESKYFFVPWH
jgi:hypothetical protein